MGSCVSKVAVPQQQQKAAETTTRAASSTSGEPTNTATRTALDKSLAFFDSKADPKELESIRSQFRGTVYYDALDSSVLLQEVEDKPQEEFRYAPAQVANPHRRATVLFDHSATLLKQEKGGPSDAAPAQAVAAATTKEQLMKTQAVMQGLRDPGISVKLDGYPGDLTPSELEACKDFRNRLKEKDPAYREMVLAMSPTEEEPYAICRFMRARRFDVDAVFAMMDGNAVDLWKKNAGRYDSVETATGQSGPVFSTQFPQVYSGLAYSGTVVSFMRMGGMSLDGMSCLTQLDSLSNYMWYHFEKRLPSQAEKLQQDSPEVVVRCEEMDIVDLKNLTSAQVSSAFIDAMKNMFTPTACFPEILNKAVVLNAPGFFSFVWRIIKVFLDPRTTYKVEIFSDAAKGHARLAELMDPAFIPSDYGGQAPSFESLLQTHYCGKGKRVQHQLVSTTKRKATVDWSFDLRDGERAMVDVFTPPSNSETPFSVHHAGATMQAKVGPQPAGSHKPTTIASNLEGTGSVKVTAHGSGVEHFLVIAHITCSS